MNSLLPSFKSLIMWVSLPITDKDTVTHTITHVSEVLEVRLTGLS